MSQTKIQFFAKVLTYSRPEGLPDGQLVFVVEYINVNGPRKSGKVSITLNVTISLRVALKKELAKALGTLENRICLGF